MSKNKIKGLFQDRRLLVLLLCGGLGLLLLVFSGITGKKEESSSDEKSYIPDADAYAQRIEEEVKSLCSGVKGVGEVQVAVTLKGGYRAIYATDSQSNAAGYKSNTVLIGSGSSEEAILIGYENPQISGIGIVCRGANDPGVKESIISLVAAAFDLGTNKIYVAVGQES